MADTRSRILNSDDLESESLVIPEWDNVEIEVRAMSGRDRAAIQRHFRGDEFDLETWYTELILATVYDPETGEKIFEPADRKEIGGKSSAILERIAAVATRLSGMGPSSVSEAEGELKSE